MVIDDVVTIELRAIAGAGIRRLVFASSMVVYGEGAYRCRQHGSVRPLARAADDLALGDFEVHCPHCGAGLDPELIGEDAPLDPRNAYAATKVHGEHLAATWARETDGVAAALRFHNVYGPSLPRNTPYAGVAANGVTSSTSTTSPVRCPPRFGRHSARG